MGSTHFVRSAILTSTVYVVDEVNMLVHTDANVSMEGKNELNKHSQNNILVTVFGAAMYGVGVLDSCILRRLDTARRLQHLRDGSQKFGCFSV